jgi:phosphopantetheinyl transferase
MTFLIPRSPDTPLIRLSITRIGDETLAELTGKCTAEEAQASLRHSRNHRRLQFFQGRLSTRALLPPGNWRIGVDSQGRPMSMNAAGAPGPDLSISHSGVWVAAAAVEHGRIGIDLETPRPGRDVQGIAGRFFSEGERKVVAEEGEAALLAFWTMREAVSKLSGNGVAEALGLDGTPFPLGRNSSCSGGDWVLAHRDCDVFQIAVAWSASPLPPEAARMLEATLDKAVADQGRTSMPGPP